MACTGVWIELPKPADAADAARICGLANRMLARLNGAVSPFCFGWDAKRGRYWYGDAMTSETLADWGKWFNLEHFGRPE